MDGPSTLVRSLTPANVRDKYGNVWQYNSRSDHHSKVACWLMLFDLLQSCALMRQHAAEGKIGFGINHEMREFRTGRKKKKNLDLVVCTLGGATKKKVETFVELGAEYLVALSPAQLAALRDLPQLSSVSVGSVLIAMEAKACMTEHVKALPRLYDELNSSQLAIHGSADFAIAAGFAMVNMAKRFISSDRNRRNLATASPSVTVHRQPAVTERTVEMLREIPRRTQQGTEGFDAFGVVVVSLVNDGSEVELVTAAPSPPVSDELSYDQMVRRIASLYGTKFGNL